MSPAGSSSTFAASADARLIAIDVALDPPVLFAPLIDSGVTTAQAEIDSLGNTAAFAAQPYPSESLLSVPGLIAGVTQGATSDVVPPYPLVAASNQSTPADTKTVGPIVVEARSAAGFSHGSVSDGASSAVADTTYTAESDVVRATADAVLSSLDLGGLVSIAGARAHAEATQNSGGAVQTESAFEIGSLVAMGQRIAVTENGLAVPGLGAVPVSDTSLLEPVLAALAGDGIHLEFLSKQVSADGVTSAGLRVRMDRNVPAQIAAGVETAQVVVTFGRVSARVGGAVSRPYGDPAAGPALSSTPLASDGFNVSTAAVPTGRPLSDRLVKAPAVDGGRVATATPDLALLSIGASLKGMFVSLVVAAVIAVALINLIRILGVRDV